VVQSLVTMSFELGTTIIAEGVEREEERAVLCDLGVTLLQGWLFGKPHEVIG
jgi:EAL domain-containing protein (putative c-di-GMP-specific phosphodiesterase class I)